MNKGKWLGKYSHPMEIWSICDEVRYDWTPKTYHPFTPPQEVLNASLKAGVFFGFSWPSSLGVEPKYGGFYHPKWMVKIRDGKPYCLMDDLGGFPIFQLVRVKGGIGSIFHPQVRQEL